MSDYCLEVAEYMYATHGILSVDKWQELLVCGPRELSDLLVSMYAAAVRDNILKNRLLTLEGRNGTYYVKESEE